MKPNPVPVRRRLALEVAAYAVEHLEAVPVSVAAGAMCNTHLSSPAWRLRHRPPMSRVPPRDQPKDAAGAPNLPGSMESPRPGPDGTRIQPPSMRGPLTGS